MTTIAIIDYGMGNLRSVANALTTVSQPSDRIVVSANPDLLATADKIVFPGQGAAKDCMQELQNTGLAEFVKHIENKKPFLGICMGMQVLLSRSDENGGTECLGRVKGSAHHFSNEMAFKQDTSLKIPHMGWNRVTQRRPHPLWDGIPDGERFYFVHSYFAEPNDSAIISATTDYGFDFCSGIAFGNVFAVQFHPEKSGPAGLRLFKNFIAWNGDSDV